MDKRSLFLHRCTASMGERSIVNDFQRKRLMLYVFSDSVDGGDEVRFSIELTKIKNLPGLLSLDIKRLRGNIWSFKFVYQTVLE
jgi:hypothetical protein